MNSMSRGWRAGVIVVALGALAGCSPTMNVSVIKPSEGVIPAADVGNMRVAKLDVAYETDQAKESDRATIRQRLESDLASCATGTRPVHLEVVIEGFAGQHAAGALLGGGGVELAGFVRVRDATSDKLIAEYYNQEIHFVNGTIIGSLAVANTAAFTSDGFSKRICKEVFGRDPVRPPPTPMNG